MRYVHVMSWRGPVFALLLVGGAAWVACADFSANDAPVDAGAADSNGGTEASGEAGPIGDGGAAGCARFADATFCVDFEEPDPLSGTVWSAPRTTVDAGTIEVTTERSVSPSHAASFVMRDGGPACDSLVLERRFAGDYPKFRARASASLETGGFFFIVSSHPSDSIRYVLLVSMRELAVDMAVEQNGPDGGSYRIDTASVPFDTTPFGIFQDVMVEIDVATQRARLTVGSTSKEAKLPAGYTTRDPRLTLGPFCHNTGQRVLIDDVAAWVTP
jgi:hypothetical protein